MSEKLLRNINKLSSNNKKRALTKDEWNWHRLTKATKMSSVLEDLESSHEELRNYVTHINHRQINKQHAFSLNEISHRH